MARLSPARADPPPPEVLPLALALARLAARRQRKLMTSAPADS